MKKQEIKITKEQREIMDELVEREQAYKEAIKYLAEAARKTGRKIWEYFEKEYPEIREKGTLGWKYENGKIKKL